MSVTIRWSVGNSPAFCTRSVSLVPLEEKHFLLLREWENDIASLFLWTTRKRVSSRDEFAQTIREWADRHCHAYFVIELSAAKKIVGFIYCSNTNLNDSWGHVTTYIEPRYRKSGVGAKAHILFLDFLFSYYSFRKIYYDVYSYNKISIKTILNAGGVKEGELREHRFWKGKYYSLYKMAMYREIFYDRNSSILKKLIS